MSDLQNDVSPPRTLSPSPAVPHIDKSSRRALFASWLGWTFDGFETYALVLVGPTAVMAVGT
ncbi:MFS transporter, partial [Streptomyces antimycoticus]